MRLGKIIFGLSVLAVALELAGGLATRLGLWHFRTGLKAFILGGQLGAAVAVAAFIVLLISVFGGRARTGKIWASLGLLIGAGAFLPIYIFKSRVDAVPRIHNITTDTNNPPVFDRITRKPDENPLLYEGGEVARLQEQAYPEIQTRIVSLPVKDTFAKALQVVQSLGWKVAAADLARGHIEATDTTLFFGFKDDVVIRILATAPNESKIDVRSVSRVGLSDLGVNAERIQRFFMRLKDSTPVSDAVAP
ncbi:MAG: DUF1499 domain-containing protein [Bdellovibrionales bacterium]